MILYIISFLIVAFGQPAMVPYLGVLAAAFGFALFWKSVSEVSRQRRFWLALVWFAGSQAIQLQWMASTHYLGGAILGVYVGLVVAMGVQFGLISLFFERGKPLSLRRCLSVAGSWTLLEWSRLFFLTGFSFNPVGISLSDTIAIQFAAVGGVFLLSFWVIWVNLLAFNALWLRKKRSVALWASFALIPYLFGWIHPALVGKWQSPAHEVKMALVQTALMPEQRSYTRVSPKSYIQPLEQWKRVCDLISEEDRLDLIVLPESAFPFGASRPFVSYERAKSFWIAQFGKEAEKDLPPYEERVNQSFFAQALANHFQTHLIIGLDDQDMGGSYNAAFHFQPQKKASRYEKRILVPVSEYLPLGNVDWLSAFYAKEYNIFDSCTPGKEAKIFSAFMEIGPSICYEETFGEAMRELRVRGAELFVNLTNDVWYPRTSLPQQHFHHARLRSAENGVFLLRSCNTGVTGIVDSFGKAVMTLPVSETRPAVLHFTASITSHPTLYTFWGNGMILAVSFLGLWYGRRSD